MLKLMRLVLAGASRVLLGRFANFGGMAAFGDLTPQALWAAAL
jgi:hypothetical protein